MNDQILSKLKQLKIDDIDSSFSTHKEWNDWADNVAPLLKFNSSYYASFMNSLQYIRIESLSAQTILPHLHNMVGIVKQAIIELENNITSPQQTKNKEIPLPDKITLKWLYTHVPYRFWTFLLGLLLAAFILGTTFASTQLYKSFIDLITAKSSTTTIKEKNAK